jgi:hypothetical protein
MKNTSSRAFSPHTSGVVEERSSGVAAAIELSNLLFYSATALLHCPLVAHLQPQPAFGVSPIGVGG